MDPSRLSMLEGEVVVADGGEVVAARSCPHGIMPPPWWRACGMCGRRHWGRVYVELYSPFRRFPPVYRSNITCHLCVHSLYRRILHMLHPNTSDYALLSTVNTQI